MSVEFNPLLSLGSGGEKHRVRVDRDPLPPTLVLSETCDREMEVRRVGRRISRSPHVADPIPALDDLSLAKSIGITVEMSVVVAVLRGAVELVDRQTTLDAREELGDRSVHRGENGSPARGQDVDRFVPPLAARLGKRIAQVRSLRSFDGQNECALSERELFERGRWKRRRCRRFGKSGPHTSNRQGSDRRRRGRGGKRDRGQTRGRRRSAHGELARRSCQKSAGHETARAPEQEISQPRACEKSQEENSDRTPAHQSVNIASVPGLTISESSITSQLVSRMQPCDWVFPT